MSLEQFFESMEDSCVPVTYTEEGMDDSSVIFAWSATGVGFGSIQFYVKDGVLRCENECMGKEFIKRMLCNMVDDAEMNDVRDEDGNWKPHAG